MANTYKDIKAGDEITEAMMKQPEQKNTIIKLCLEKGIKVFRTEEASYIITQNPDDHKYNTRRYKHKLLRQDDWKAKYESLRTPIK